LASENRGTAGRIGEVRLAVAKRPAILLGALALLGFAAAAAYLV
jgi:hypothetical protein